MRPQSMQARSRSVTTRFWRVLGWRRRFDASVGLAYGSVLPEVDAEVTTGLAGLLSGSSRGLFAASGTNDKTPGSAARPLNSDFNGGAEGSRTPGLLDATEETGDTHTR